MYRAASDVSADNIAIYRICVPLSESRLCLLYRVSEVTSGNVDLGFGVTPHSVGRCQWS